MEADESRRLSPQQQTALKHRLMRASITQADQAADMTRQVVSECAGEGQRGHPRAVLTPNLFLPEHKEVRIVSAGEKTASHAECGKAQITGSRRMVGIKVTVSFRSKAGLVGVNQLVQKGRQKACSFHG